jgi:N-acetylmuramoyl-L-alanine amidase
MNLLQFPKINYKIKQFIFTLIVFQLFSFSTQVNAQKKVFTVVLDAGHGGHDSGNTGYSKKYKEKDVALAIVLQLGKILNKQKDIKIIYTRTKDVFVELGDRAKIANKSKADLFVSIHCNAHHSQASGTETFVLGVANTARNFAVAKAENEVILLEDNYEKKYKGFDPSSPESTIGLSLLQEEFTDKSILLASLIEANFVRIYKRKSRGVKQASLWVMHQTYMPSVLIETGFLTNRQEGAYLNSKKGKAEMSSSISKAIIKHIEGVRLNTVSEVDKAFLEKKVLETNTNTLYFKVQIASGKTKLNTASYNFKGLEGIERVPIGDYYKYYLGNTESYKAAKKMLKKAKRAGYKSSFIAAFKGNERVSLSEVIK